MDKVLNLHQTHTSHLPTIITQQKHAHLLHELIEIPTRIDMFWLIDGLLYKPRPVNAFCHSLQDGRTSRPSLSRCCNLLFLNMFLCRGKSSCYSERGPYKTQKMGWDGCPSFQSCHWRYYRDSQHGRLLYWWCCLLSFHQCRQSCGEFLLYFFRLFIIDHWLADKLLLKKTTTEQSYSPEKLAKVMVWRHDLIKRQRPLEKTSQTQISKIYNIFENLDQ